MNYYRNCRSCKSTNVVEYPVIFHYLCGYIGPSYDFNICDASAVIDGGGVIGCPKCKRILSESQSDWEIAGSVIKCLDCDYEFPFYKEK
jgi:hypothetical protein